MATIKLTMTPAFPQEPDRQMTLVGVDPGVINAQTGWTTFTGVTTRRPVAAFPPGAIRCWEVIEDNQVEIADVKTAVKAGLSLVHP